MGWLGPTAWAAQIFESVPVHPFIPLGVCQEILRSTFLARAPAVREVTRSARKGGFRKSPMELA